MSSLQEALNQRKSKIETAVSTKVSASGKKKSGVRRRSDPSPPSRKNTRLIGGHFPPENRPPVAPPRRRGKNKRCNRSGPSPRGNQRSICEEGQESLTATGVGILKLREGWKYGPRKTEESASRARR